MDSISTSSSCRMLVVVHTGQICLSQTRAPHRYYRPPERPEHPAAPQNRCKRSRERWKTHGGRQDGLARPGSRDSIPTGHASHTTPSYASVPPPTHPRTAKCSKRKRLDAVGIEPTTFHTLMILERIVRSENHTPRPSALEIVYMICGQNSEQFSHHKQCIAQANFEETCLFQA
jgi:hypothetical protein